MKKNDEEIKLVEDWLKFAEENFRFACLGIDEEFSPNHTICFLCQGSAEKYLKAFLIWNNWELKKIHDLKNLLAYCIEYDDEFETLKRESGILNEYITIGRYPADLPFEDIGKEDALEAINAARIIKEFVLERIDTAKE